MATLSITIATSDIDLLAKSLNYQATIKDTDGVTDIPNPQTKGNFCKDKIINNIKERIKNQKAQDAVVAANITEPDIT